MIRFNGVFRYLFIEIKKLDQIIKIIKFYLKKSKIILLKCTNT